VLENGGSQEVVLLWFYCKDAIQGDRFTYQMVDGVEAHLRARAWRGDDTPGPVFQQTVSDHTEHSVELTIPLA
jgi:hypothetical protein